MIELIHRDYTTLKGLNNLLRYLVDSKLLNVSDLLIDIFKTTDENLDYTQKDIEILIKKHYEDGI